MLHNIDCNTLNQQNLSPSMVYLHDYQPSDFLCDQVELNFSLDPGATVVKSSLHLKRNPASKAPNRDLHLNGENLKLESVFLAEEQLTADQYRVTAEELIIFNVPQAFVLHITTLIKPELNKALCGLYLSGENFTTQCEAQGFRHITYFLDRPDVLSFYTTTITANAAQYPILLSNGNLIASGNNNNGDHWVTWQDPVKKPCYLFALVAGKFALLEDSFITQSGKAVKLRIYVEQNYIQHCHHAMQSLKKAMRWDELNYNRQYDLDIYMLVGINDFNMGAMENKGLNIFNTQTLLASPETATDDDYINIESVIAHEYFHNWTGNRITCRDWFQLSLKEGLTIFRDQSFLADSLASAATRIDDVNFLRTRQFAEDAGPLAHPVQPYAYLQIDNFYTTTIYNKGAEIVRMLETILGQKLFRQAMDLYFTRYDGQAVTIEDFMHVMEEVSTLNLQQFMLWYKQAGTPQVTVRSSYDAQNKIYSLSFTQFCPATPEQQQKQPLHIPLAISLFDTSGRTLPLYISPDDTTSTTQPNVVLQFTEPTTTFNFYYVPSKPIPSLLRGFSAPVKLHYDYSDAELITLCKYDTDQFNRWSAGQEYSGRIILRLMADYQQNKPLVLPPALLSMWSELLDNLPEDKFFSTQMLSLPTVKYLITLMPIVEIDTIYKVHDFIALELASALVQQWTTCYNAYAQTSVAYQYDVVAIGQRKLKNLCLHYLMLLAKNKSSCALAMEQFLASVHSNMSDTLAALACLVNIAGAEREQALAKFYNVWHNNPLIIDKWLALQAGSQLASTPQQIQQLLMHEAFAWTNPNNVYALLGTFAQRNLRCFHALNGEGYSLLGESVAYLDKFNPIVAASMVKPLLDWKRYDKIRQNLMYEQLNMLIKIPNISKDLYEIVNKSL